MTESQGTDRYLLDLINSLNMINRRFLYSTIRKLSTISSHYEELLNLFVAEMPDDSPLKYFIPIFFTLNDYDNWDDLDSYEYANCYTQISKIDRQYSFQSKINEEIGVHFTKTIVDYQNQKRIIKENFNYNLNIRITLDANIDEEEILCYHDEKNNLYTYSVSKLLQKNLLTDCDIVIKDLQKKSQPILKIESIKDSLFKEKVSYIKSSIEDSFTNNVLPENSGIYNLLNKLAPAALSHAFYINNKLDLLFIFSNTVSDFDNERILGLGGAFILIDKNIINDTDSLKELIEICEQITNKLAIRIINYYQLEAILKQQLKTAIISILIDSYAHNISAHSLSALKWWFELRFKMMDKRFKIPDVLTCLQPVEISISQENDGLKAMNYYTTLGKEDSIYNNEYFSLFDILQFTDNPLNSSQLFQFVSEVFSPDEVKFSPKFPTPIDYALFPFFRFLRDKGAFWSGVTRDSAFGGESKTWYQVLWEDFANNPLYLGTIAKSEGITKLNINLAVYHKNDWIAGRFVTIDLSLINVEERLANSKNLKIEYQKEDYYLLVDYIRKLQKNDEYKAITIENKERNDILSDYGQKIINILDNKLIDIFYNNSGIAEEKSTDIDIVAEDKIANCNWSNELYIKESEYGKYAFIRLGKCFSKFREILNSEEYTAFLPGGVVGEHALFTIFENTIRNIKHYKDEKELKNIRENGIDFWISIEHEALNLRSYKRDKNKLDELFKINIWLGHKTRLSENNKTLWEKVTEATKKSILDENGVPRMGGNSQDKACAAMLFNNKFDTVQEDSGIRNEDYYPWIHFTTNIGEKDTEYETANDQPLSAVQCRIEGKNYDEIFNTYKDSFEINDHQTGFLKRQFYLWRSDDYFIVKNENDLKGGNISRFKFVLIKPDAANQDKLIMEARQVGAIRLIYKDKDPNLKELIKKLDKDLPDQVKKENKNISVLRDLRLQELYSIWLKYWIPYDSDNRHKIALKIDQDSSVLELSESDNKVEFSFKSLNDSDIVLPLSHGGSDESSCCNLRSHGIFWTKFFNKVRSRDIDDLVKKDLQFDDVINEKFLAMEFTEVVATKVLIFDNRLKNRMPVDLEKIAIFEKHLNLFVYEEKNLTTSTNKNNQGTQGLFKNELIGIISENGSPNTLVIHLSYIETLGYKETEKGFMNRFIRNELPQELISKDNFIFIIVSGRGRNSWIDDLEDEYTKKTLFKPVESFINAIESGISYNDNFDVKYNITRVIFGS